MKKTIYISEETFNELTKPKKKKTSHLNPDKWYEDKADFSISSSEGDLGYAHVAGGDASFGGMMENKTIFITEEQAGQIRLLLEGDDRIKKVNRIMDTAFNGILNLDDVVTSPEYYINGDRSTTWRKYILFSFRHTFGLMTNADMQYLPFVARLAFSDEVGFEKRNDNGAEISKLQKIVNYLKRDSKFFNEIKANPSITFSEVCTRLEPILKEMDAADLEAANRVETRDDYEIKVVPDFKTANYYGNHTCSTSKLCYTQSSNTWDSYTKHGENKVYVCLKNGWENIPEEPGPGNPYDEYGTSIIFVFINPDGDMVYSNCRWNHSTVGSYNGSVDNAFTKASLSQTVGVRFENVFKPFSPEELAEKGIKVHSNSFVQKKIDEGTPLDEIFDWVDKEKKFGIDDCFIVSFYGDEDEYYDKFNIVLNGKLLSSTWATSIPKIYNVSGRIFFEFINNRLNDGTYYSVIDENGNLLGGTRFSCILEFINSMKCFIVENREEKFNLLRIDGRILSQTWFEYIQQPWTDDIGCVIVSVKKNNKTYSDKLYNLMDADGRLLSQEWFSDMTNFLEGFARVEREDGDSNLIGLDGKLVSNKWFLDCNTFSGGLARIVEKNPSDNKLYVNFIDKSGELYSNQWFKRSERAYYSFGRVHFVWREDGKVSFINQNNILINEWFDSIGNFDGIWALVSNDKKENFINYAGGLFSEFWFDSFFGNPGTARGSGFLVGQWMNGKWNAIDIKDRTLVSEYGFNSMEEMSNALLDKKPSVAGELLHENINYSKFNMLCEGVNDTDLHKYIESYLDFLERNNYKINPRPAIEFNNKQQDGMNIRTGYYDPDERKVVVFINGRHVKDILRSFAHEMVHHMQNLRDEHMDWGHGGDLVDDDKLRELEGEAYHVGNILFREWTEELKKTGKLNESRGSVRKNGKGEVVPDTCDKCGGKVVCQIHGEPVYTCKECGKYFGTVPFDLEEINEAKESDVDLSSFKIQDKLNPKIWVNDLMDSRVRLKLLDIAQDFVEFLDVTWVKPEDTIVVGSIANYNWSRYSDIDLHVVIDYSKVDDRKKFVENYFQSKKKEWNDTHDKISIFGFPVELYVQDKDADNASSAVYSIDKNKWLKKPTRNTFTKKDIDSESIKKRASKIMTDIENIEDDDKDSNDEYRNRKLYDRSSSLIDDITNKRKKSLSATKDEMNTDNLVFKVLRRNGYLDKLFNLRDKTYDKMNSLD